MQEQEQRKISFQGTIKSVQPIKDGSPWLSEVPELSAYAWRGCRMLDKSPQDQPLHGGDTERFAKM